MRSTNIATGAFRYNNVGLRWFHVFNGSAAGVIANVLPRSTLRISAGADCTVVIDGITSLMLRTGEVEYINVGAGEPNNSTKMIAVSVTCTDVYVSIADENETGYWYP